jgi:hypothetical protein
MLLTERVEELEIEALHLPHGMKRARGKHKQGERGEKVQRLPGREGGDVVRGD